MNRRPRFSCKHFHCGTRAGCELQRAAAIAAVLLAAAFSAHAQFGEEPGHSIGNVTVQGKLILLTLNDGVLGPKNLFDLSHHLLRFTPTGAGYRVENIPFAWDAGFGTAITSPQVTLSGGGLSSPLVTTPAVAARTSVTQANAARGMRPRVGCSDKSCLRHEPNGHKL